MPRRIDQLPADATTLARRIAALEREVRELRASRRMSNATAGGGDTTITGARIQTAASGARIVLDADGVLTVYDASGHKTFSMGGDGNDAILWNQAGWDPDGTPNGEWVALNDGNFLLGVGDASNLADLDQTKAGLLGVLGVGFGIGTQSAAKAPYTEQSFMEWLAGTDSGGTGTVNAPTAQLTSASGVCDLGVQSSVVKLSSSFDTTAWRRVPEVWQTPTWGSGWSGTNTLGTMGGFRSLAARLCVEDNVWVVGAAATTGTGGSIGTLPAAFCPPSGQRVLLPAYFNKSGTITSGFVQITEAGTINSSPSLGGITPAAGTQVYINGHYPLGNLP